MENLLQGHFPGRLYAVNPGYESVCGVACHACLSDLPETVDQVIFAVADARVEAALDDTIEHGAQSITLMSSLVMAGDSQPPLLQRVARRVREADLLVCGGNAMGFFNFTGGVWACGFDTREHRADGNVTLISHSGSGMCGIVDVDERIDFNLAVSTGQELCVGMHDYLDYALEQPETRVVGLFMETARDPAALCRAFEKANQKRIPIVALKVGRTALSARLAVSHSGAVAGEDAAYQALFERYGVQRVADMDQLATTLILFAQPHPVGDGGLVSLHDSGGERQLLIDLASDLQVSMASLSATSVASLEHHLDPGLPAVNPLDAWSAGGPDSDRVMEDCLVALMSDQAAALGAVVHDRAPAGKIYPHYIQYMRKGHQATGKPVFLVSSRQGTGSDPLVVSTTREGFPVVDGVGPFLKAVKCLFDYRDFCQREPSHPPPVPVGASTIWRERLANGAPLDEADALSLLADFELPVNPARVVEDESQLLNEARELGFPLVLKTAQPGIKHKTDCQGVILDLSDESELLSAYQTLGASLGPRALIAPMISGTGVEMILGMVRDAQFGPLVTLGFGGVQVETIKDLAFALPPFDAVTARRLLDTLHLRPLLDARRGRPPMAVDAFCQAAARFSVMVASLGEQLMEVDVNPMIVHSSGCIAVDALVHLGETEARGQ
jgi:acyl-CoA synthetase (NDP forming)